MSSAEILQIIAALFGALATFISSYDKKIIDRLKKNGNIDRGTAVDIPSTGRFGRWRDGKLKGAGVLREPEPGKIYLDRDAYTGFRKKRLKRVITIILAAVAVVVILYFL